MAITDTLQIADLEPVGPGTPAGRYLRQFWHPVYRASDLPSGRAMPIEILGEKFTLYRGETGAAHVVAFRCAHRGAQLSLGWVEGDDLRCRYHGWKFDCTGQCIEQPNDEKSFAQRVKMPGYPTREYAGLIFAYFGEDAAPPVPHYPDIDRPGVVVADPIELVPCNYWNRLDNDIYHIPWVHRATAIRKGRNDFTVARREKVEETDYGWKSTRFATSDVEGFRDISGSAHFFMPNVYQFGVRTRAKGFEGRNLWDTKITWTVPVNDAAFAAFDVTHTPLSAEEARAYEAMRTEQQDTETDQRWDIGDKILAGKMTIEQIPDNLSAYASFAIEDYATQVSQGSLVTRGREIFSQNDAKVVLLRRLYLQEVRKLLEGEALTQWKLPTDPIQVIPTT